MPQFAEEADTRQTYFTNVLFPQSYLGFWAVMAVLAVHLALVSLIVVAFALCSEHTLLGNHWQSIAHLQAPETHDLIAKTRDATDAEVKTALRAAGHGNARISIRSLDHGDKAGLRLIRRKDTS